MDVDGLAQSAVEVVAQHLAQRGTDAVGRLADVGVERIYQLLASRLQRSPAGQSMLSWFHQSPADQQSQRRLAEALTGEIRDDPRFAESLRQAVGRVGVLVRDANTSQQVIDNRGKNVAGQDVRIKQHQFHIGRFQFGTGGLVTGVVGLVVLLGGGTVATVGTQAKPANLGSAVGRWERSGEKPLPGFETNPTVLTISPGGRFTFSTGIRMNVPGEQRPPAGFPDFSSIRLDCGGIIEPMEDRFTLRSTSGQCGTFEAKLSTDRRILDVFLSNGSANGSTALTKVSP